MILKIQCCRHQNPNVIDLCSVMNSKVLFGLFGSLKISMYSLIELRGGTQLWSQATWVQAQL